MATAEEQSRMWSEDSVQPDHRPAQTLADPFGILVSVASGWAELPWNHRLSPFPVITLKLSASMQYGHRTGSGMATPPVTKVPKKERWRSGGGVPVDQGNQSGCAIRGTNDPESRIVPSHLPIE